MCGHRLSESSDCFCRVMFQGLGLLINLVEYSARNKYCLMEMEMEGGQGPCNSTVLMSPPHQDISSTGPLSAIAALVQVTGPELANGGKKTLISKYESATIK